MSENGKQPAESKDLAKPPTVQDEEKVKFKRVMTFWDATLFIICGIIGSGIFISPKGVLKQTGSTGMALVMWFVTGLISCLIGLCYAELATTFPRAGSEYLYLQRGLGDWAGFLFIWVNFCFTDGAGRAVVALTFSKYFSQMFFAIDAACPIPEALPRVIATIAICTLTVIQCYSSKYTVKFSDFSTVAKLIGLLIIIVVGIGYLATGRTENLNLLMNNTSTDMGSYVIAYYSAFWAYSGLNGALNVVEEIEKPLKRNILISVILSHVVIIVVYMLTNLAYVLVVTPSGILATDAIAMSLASKVFSGLFWLMPLFVSCSTIGTLNNGIMSTSRQMFAAAREGHLPSAIGLLHHHYFTPIPVLLLNSGISIIMLCFANIGILIYYTGYVGTIAQVLSIFVLIYLRVTKPDLERPFRLPLIVPCFALLVLTVLLVYPIYQRPKPTAICFAFVASGIPAFLLTKLEKKPDFLLKLNMHFTRLSQKLFNALPEDKGGSTDDVNVESMEMRKNH